MSSLPSSGQALRSAPNELCGQQATVTINVGVNTAPVAVDDSAVAEQTTATLTSPATGNVLTNDTDADAGDTKTVTAVAGGSVFAAERKGKVRAFDAATGKELWVTDTQTEISSGVGVGESLVLVGNSDAEVVALDWRDGHEVWRTQVSSEVLSVSGADQGTVVIQSVDGKLTGLNASDGSRLWVFDRTVPVLSLRGTASPLVTCEQAFEQGVRREG